MSTTHTAFFYGTLLHPSILRRVIGHEGGDLKMCPGLLLEHTRHKIKIADYPAMIPYSRSKPLFKGKELPAEERCVRGTLVTGLNDEDVALLDTFEGDEYTRETVSVHPLTEFFPLSSKDTSHDSDIVPSIIPSVPPLDSLSPPISAQTYIWKSNGDHLLSTETWEFEDFIQNHESKWVGSDVQRADYVEVDKRRAMNGSIVHHEIIKEPGEKAKAVVEVEDASKS
ncbi:Protein AIG2-like protein [Abortiporus biennis]